MEPRPLRMTHLRAEETAHRIERRALAAQHPVERPDRAVSADDPENAETAQRVDRYDTASLQSKQRIYVTHREPVLESSEGKRTQSERVSIKIPADCGLIRRQRFYQDLSGLPPPPAHHSGQAAPGHGNSSGRQRIDHNDPTRSYDRGPGYRKALPQTQSFPCRA